MKQSLELRVSQQLTMTPQLQQAIRLLQLPAAELSLEIRDALESNVMLEAEEEAETAGSGDETNMAEQSTIDPSEAPLGSSAADASRLGEDMPVDERWDDPAAGAATPSAPDPARRDSLLDNQAGPEASLRDHLHWQVEMSSLSDRDRRIAEAVIDALDQQGHLTESSEELCEALADDDIEQDDIRAVIAVIQHMDPVGVAAGDAREALRLQIDALPEDTPHRELARLAIAEDLRLLGPGQHATLRRRLGIDEETLTGVLSLIQQLDPHPGSGFGETRTEYVIPDCFVHRINGRWEVEVNPDASPRIRVNDYYASLVRRGDTSADNSLLRQHLQEARWLIKSLQSRSETLQKVAECIVERQQGFLEHGEEAMQPLVLREVAEAIDMHESTVSRITSRKYMRTPQGTLEFKHFFSSHVPTADGGECSATAIRARIRRLVAAEDPARPLSDSRLTDILREEGINVARRTVAKYREVMGIASSTDRKRLV
ncbi:RNA polymerase factor sigma-54 [Spiribacter insolitus]|uniref:RNA polymerase sigma-54 factor n=1 Tax=Spiribacter insolitus TaxID=3122417 RepID=A0ABV3T7R9_9GAMM